MLTTLLIWAYTLAVTALYGWAVMRLLQRTCRAEGQKLPPLPVMCVVGLAFLTTLVSLLSLFMRVNIEAVLLVTAGAACIAWFYSQENKLPQIRFTFPAQVWRAAAWLLVVLCLATVLENATHKPVNPDTGIYHAQAIRWIETFPAVPGLGNLHTRLAYNSSWLVSNALFSFVFIGGPSFHLLGSVFFVIFLGYLFAGLFRFASGNARHSDILRVFLIPVSFWVFAAQISSPGTDLPAALLIWILLLEFLTFLEQGGEVYPFQAEVLLGLSVYTVTVKLSAAPIVLIGLYALVWKFRRSGFKGVGPGLVVGGLVLLPWLARNVVLSGYLVYPRPELDFFTVDWKIPLKVAAAEKDVITAWARIPGRDAREVLQMPLREWVPLWFSRLTPNRKAMLGTVVLAPLTYLLVGLVCRKHARRVLQQLAPYAPAFGAAYAGGVFWFFTAPDFRFGSAFVVAALLMAALPTLVLIERWVCFKRASVIGAILFVLLAYQANVLASSFEVETLGARALLPRDYVHLTTAPCALRNRTVWCAEAYNECWYEPFPCVPNANPAVETRGPTLREGFRSVEGKP